MPCAGQITPTQNGPICSLLSGWATTTSRLPGPKIALGIFRTQHRRTTALRVEPRFCDLSITSPALYHLSCVAAAICYYLSNHLKVEAIPLNALPEDTTSELSGLSSRYPFNAERQYFSLLV